MLGGRPVTVEYTKMLQRRRQELMANELSRQAVDDYLEDIMRHMRQMEVRDLGPPHCLAC